MTMSDGLDTLDVSSAASQFLFHLLLAFSVFLKHIFTEMPPACLRGSAVPWVDPLEPSGAICMWHRATVAPPHRGHPSALTASAWAMLSIHCFG